MFRSFDVSPMDVSPLDVVLPGHFAHSLDVYTLRMNMLFPG